MNRRKVWMGEVAGLIGLVVLSAWLPGYRLERELAAARAEGLWTEAADVRRAIGTPKPEENAAPLVRALVAEGTGRGLEAESLRAPLAAVLKRVATPAQTATVRALCAKNADLAARWRAAAVRPRLVFNRPWEDGYAVVYPETFKLRRTVQLLCASARLGLSPRENLLAATRLSALIAQEPALISQIVSVSLGKFALREAKHEGVEREIEAELGPPLDLRRVYAFEFYDMLQTMRRLGSEEYDGLLGDGFYKERDWRYRLGHTGPWRANAIRRFVSLWRDFWRETPCNGSDYPTVIRALERRMPTAARAAADYDDIFGVLLGGPDDPDDKNVADGVRAFQKFEVERAAIREDRR